MLSYQKLTLQIKQHNIILYSFQSRTSHFTDPTRIATVQEKLAIQISDITPLNSIAVETIKAACAPLTMVPNVKTGIEKCPSSIYIAYGAAYIDVIFVSHIIG